MNEYIVWFNQVLTVSIQHYFQQECEYTSLEQIRLPSNGLVEKVADVQKITFKSGLL